MKQIAIDGPAGSGKSTIAKLLSDKLGYLYIDTGAMYRAITFLAIENKVCPEDEKGLETLLKSFNFRFEKVDLGQRIYLGEREITKAIRSQVVSEQVASYAQVPLVRAFLSDYQRALAKESAVVMDGRDIGTVILPFASDKFFLTASPEVRAKRRTRELYPDDDSYKLHYEGILEGIKARDDKDAKRALAPLKQAEDAILINTDDKTIEEVLEAIISALS